MEVPRYGGARHLIKICGKVARWVPETYSERRQVLGVAARQMGARDIFRIASALSTRRGGRDAKCVSKDAPNLVCVCKTSS
jgi:hypothetical protein